jgi:hypothetical protein
MSKRSVPEALGISEDRSDELFEALRAEYDRVVNAETTKSDVMKMVIGITRDPGEIAMLCFFMGELWSEQELSDPMPGIIIALEQEPPPPTFGVN